MKNIKILFYALLIAFSFNSCELNDDSEISGHDLTGSSEIIGWSKSDFTESYFSDLGTIEKKYPINLINGSDAGKLSKDVSYTISIVESESTATEGTDGEFTLNSTSGMFNAGDDFSNVSIGINTGNFNPTAPTHVVFLIEANTNGVVVSSLTKKMKLSFVGCTSSLEGTYTDIFGATHEITKFDDVFYRVPYLPPFSGQYWFEFKDICGELTITNWQHEGAYPLTQNAPGYVDEDGNIIFPSITVANIDWYVNRDDVKFFRN